jgi:hypothetical protein
MLVSHSEQRSETEGILQQNDKENIWTKDSWRNRNEEHYIIIHFTVSTLHLKFPGTKENNKDETKY